MLRFGRHVVLVVLGQHLGGDEGAVRVEPALRDRAAALVVEQLLLKRRTQAIVRSLRRRARAEKMDRELA